MTTRQLTASALLASALVLAGCGSGDSGSGTASGTAGTGDRSAAPAATAEQGNEADVAFLSGMKPHHEQAVAMSDLVLAADPPAAVAAVARQIKAAQAPEIAQMTALLADLGEDIAEDTAEGPTGGHGSGHGGGHGAGHSAGRAMTAGHEGMMSDAEMAALEAATGTDAARLYLEGMVRHHQGAVTASERELADGRYEPALDLARRIRTAQTAEVTRMQELLRAL